MKTQEQVNPQDHKMTVINFIEESNGLTSTGQEDSTLSIEQTIDSKTINLDLDKINRIMTRWDSNGKKFLQVNFSKTKKIIITNKLVGFKPHPSLGLDMTKLPNVVTTPDLFSVLEAIEECLLENSSSSELDVLKNVFNSVLKGAESVGFSLAEEKVWLSKIARHQTKACA